MRQILPKYFNDMGNVLELLADYYDYASMYQSIMGFIYATEHQDALEYGLACMKALDENPSQEAARDALRYLNQIDFEDKKFVQAFAYYSRAFCYTALFQFDNARLEIRRLQAIEIDFFTLKKDTIRSFQEDVDELYELVNKIEEEYIRWCREQNAGAIPNSTSPFNWKALAIGLVAVVAVLAFLLVVL